MFSFVIICLATNMVELVTNYGKPCHHWYIARKKSPCVKEKTTLLC